jgi:hypothetical protein
LIVARPIEDGLIARPGVIHRPGTDEVGNAMNVGKPINDGAVGEIADEPVDISLIRIE